MADIGSRLARLTFETALVVFEHTAVLRSAKHADFHAAVSAYLATLPELSVDRTAIGGTCWFSSACASESRGTMA